MFPRYLHQELFHAIVLFHQLIRQHSHFSGELLYLTLHLFNGGLNGKNREGRGEEGRGIEGKGGEVMRW